jgi:hypothetical protein
MTATTVKSADVTGARTRLDTIRMSADQRRHAYASLGNAELIAELVLHAAADMRAIAQFVEGAGASLAGGIKALVAKPVKH